jgi:hypothetical protein
MWAQVKSAPDLQEAEKWKELFENAGIPTRLLPEPGRPGYRVLVSQERVHVIEEILRKQ